MLHRESPATNGASSENVRAGQHHDDSEQLDIFDAIRTIEAEARRQSGMDASRYGEDVRIVSAIEADARQVARSRETFTADDVLPGLTSRRSVGAVFSKLAREGVIVCVGATTSKRADRHGGLTRVWSAADRGDA